MISGPSPAPAAISAAFLSRRAMLRSALLAGGAAALAPLLAACGSSDEDGSLVTPSSTTGNGDTGDSTGSEIDLLTVALPGSLSSLAAGTEAGILNYYVAAIAQEGLLGVDGSGSLVPAVAESWSQPDNVTYVFDLRADATFADGTPVTVDDVLFSLDMARDPLASPDTAAWWPEISSITQTGDNQITIVIPAPMASFIWMVTNAGALWITSRAFAESAGTIGTADSLILGTGPYRAVEFRPDSHATFERVDTWWGGVPSVKTVRFDFIPDENTRLLARRNGDIDMALNVPFDQLEAWEALADTEVLFTSDHSYVGLLFNQNLAPFDDINVRTAIAHAVDREAIVSSILRGHGQVALGVPTPEQLAGAVGAAEADRLLAGLPQLDFDLDAAAAALAASSVPDGFAFEIKYPNTGPQLGRAALTLAANLAEIGVNLTVTEVPLEAWFATLEDDAVGVHYIWYFSTTGDAAEVIGWYLREDNPYGFDNPEAFEHLALANTEVDVNQRISHVIEANRLANEDVALWSLWWGEAATALGNDLRIADYTPFFFLGPWPNEITSAS